VKPIEINVQPSPMLLAVLCIMHLLAAVLAWLLPWPVATSLTVLISLSFIGCWRRRRALALEINAKCELSVQQDGNWREAKVLGSCLVLPYLTVLNLKVLNTSLPFNVLVLPDSVDAKSFRRLRVWLKWGGD